MAALDVLFPGVTFRRFFCRSASNSSSASALRGACDGSVARAVGTTETGTIRGDGLFCQSKELVVAAEPDGVRSAELAPFVPGHCGVGSGSRSQPLGSAAAGRGGVEPLEIVIPAVEFWLSSVRLAAVQLGPAGRAGEGLFAFAPGTFGSGVGMMVVGVADVPLAPHPIPLRRS